MPQDESIEGALRDVGETPMPSGNADGMLDRVVANVLGHEAPLQKIGRFEVTRSLGRGGMGSVLEAWDAELERKVAIKLLRKDLGPQDRRRSIIEAEARALARLADRHVVQIYETGEQDGALFVVMELVVGTTLERWQREDPPLAELLDKYEQAARGLAAAHRAGLVHRDFKPANVLIREDGEVRVADFGLAQLIEESSHPTTEELSLSGSGSAPQARSGTLAYMAPEQLAFGTTDARSDQFSLCVALFEAICGERPFEQADLARMAQGDRVTVSRAYVQIPRWLRPAVLRGLAADADARWPSLTAFVDELIRAPGRRRRRASFAGLSLGAVGLAGAFAFIGDSRPSCDASGQLDGAWDDEVAHRLAASIPDDVAFAAEAGNRAHTQLDRYAARWSTAYGQACENTWVHGLESPERFEDTVRCLDRRRSALTGAVRLLAQGDASILGRVDDVVGALNAPETCIHETTAQPGSREQTLLAAADEATLLLAAGLPRQALAEIEASKLGRADSHQAGARVWTVRGRVHQALAQHDEAERALVRATGLAAAHEAPHLGVDALRHLVDLYAVSLADSSRTSVALELLETWSDGVDLDAHGRSALWAARGRAAALEGKGDQAIEHFERALDALPPDAPLSAQTSIQLAIGSVHQGQGRLDEASAAYERARVALSEALGPAHPDVARAVHAQATLASMRGDEASAQRHYEHALTIWTDALGPSASRRASALTGLAQIDFDQGRFDRAATRANEAWGLQQSLPPGHPDRGTALQVLAFIALEKGEYASALDHFEQLLHESPTQDDEIRVGSLINVGWLLCELGRCAQARRTYERVEAEPRVGDLWRLYLEEGLARVEVAEGRTRSARQRAERLLVRIEHDEVDDPELEASAQFIVAVCLDNSQAERRRTLAAEALATFEKLGRPTQRRAKLEQMLHG